MELGTTVIPHTLITSHVVDVVGYFSSQDSPSVNEDNADFIVPNSKAQDHIRASEPSRRYASHITLVSSICEDFDYSWQEKCDALMEGDAQTYFRVVVDGSIME